MVFSPEMVISCGPPAFIALSLTIQAPSLPEVALFFWRASLTVTFSPGSAHPQMGISIFCCNTMFSPITDGRVTSAKVGTALPANRSTIVSEIEYR